MKSKPIDKTNRYYSKNHQYTGNIFQSTLNYIKHICNRDEKRRCVKGINETAIQHRRITMLM